MPELKNAKKYEILVLIDCIDDSIEYKLKGYASGIIEMIQEDYPLVEKSVIGIYHPPYESREKMIEVIKEREGEE